jgi:hypothetical protein
MIPTEQKLVDMTDGHVVALTRVKALDINDNYVVLPSKAVDARILYTTAQTILSATSFYVGSQGRAVGAAAVTASEIANIDGTAAGTEFLIASRHTNLKNTSL